MSRENGIGYDRMDRTTLEEWRRIEDRFYASRPHVIRSAQRPSLLRRLIRWLFR